MSEDIKITPLYLIGEDERGSTYTYSLINRKDFVLISRKAGTVSGNTYHEGRASTINPKLFVLLSGQAEFSYRRVGENKHKTVLINKPSTIEVYPMVVHSVKAITDVVFLECNSIADIENDRYRELVEVEV